MEICILSGVEDRSVITTMTARTTATVGVRCWVRKLLCKFFLNIFFNDRSEHLWVRVSKGWRFIWLRSQALARNDHIRVNWKFVWKERSREVLGMRIIREREHSLAKTTSSAKGKQFQKCEFHLTYIRYNNSNLISPSILINHRRRALSLSSKFAFTAK